MPLISYEQSFNHFNSFLLFSFPPFLQLGTSTFIAMQAVKDTVAEEYKLIVEMRQAVIDAIVAQRQAAVYLDQIDVATVNFNLRPLPRLWGVDRCVINVSAAKSDFSFCFSCHQPSFFLSFFLTFSLSFLSSLPVSAWAAHAGHRLTPSRKANLTIPGHCVKWIRLQPLSMSL